MGDGGKLGASRSLSARVATKGLFKGVGFEAEIVVADAGRSKVIRSIVSLLLAWPRRRTEGFGAVDFGSGVVFLLLCVGGGSRLFWNSRV